MGTEKTKNKNIFLERQEWPESDAQKKKPKQTGDALCGSETLIKFSSQLASVTLVKVTQGYLVAVMMPTRRCSVQQ